MISEVERTVEVPQVVYEEVIVEVPEVEVKESWETCVTQCDTFFNIVRLVLRCFHLADLLTSFHMTSMSYCIHMSSWEFSRSFTQIAFHKIHKVTAGSWRVIVMIVEELIRQVGCFMLYRVFDQITYISDRHRIASNDIKIAPLLRELLTWRCTKDFHIFYVFLKSWSSQVPVPVIQYIVQNSDIYIAPICIVICCGNRIYRYITDMDISIYRKTSWYTRGNTGGCFEDKPVPKRSLRAVEKVIPCPQVLHEEHSAGNFRFLFRRNKLEYDIYIYTYTRTIHALKKYVTNWYIYIYEKDVETKTGTDIFREFGWHLRRLCRCHRCVDRKGSWRCRRPWASRLLSKCRRRTFQTRVLDFEQQNVAQKQQQSIRI